MVNHRVEGTAGKLNDAEKVAAIQALLETFTERQDGEVAVLDHMYLDFEFFPDLFKILD